MKFKAIFILFNAVLAVSFLLIFLMPLFLLGADYFSLFWARNWIIAVVFLLTLAALNAYFLYNWGLFRHLEREDWPGLVSYLEERILGRGMTRPTYIRMILNAYMVTSNTEGILALEAYLKGKKPGLIPRFSLSFGVPYLLMKDPAASEAFFAALIAAKGVADRDWVRWNRAFCQLQRGKADDAKAELAGLVESTRDPVLRMLGFYLLDVFARQDPKIEGLVTEGRSKMRREYTDPQLKKKIEKSADNVEIVILSKIVMDAREWLFSDGSDARKEPLVVAPSEAPQTDA